ncbi:uncharacterized protein CCDC197 [Bombina bombina]|uniref:uncharacterized protein CCDC197 n=1 Tax=Bombina bombina TaxID=8345 RepID=UPI00235B189B|nr:uncharacterized protein CCDC197 [Bombina bombina]
MNEYEQAVPQKEQNRYQLNLDVRKKNVFVTQLEEGRDEEDENVTQIPVIKEAASKILDTSKNTLQKTLILKKEVEYDRVSEELLNKRREINERMQELDVRKEEYEQKQIECMEKAVKYEKFLKDGEAKRRRTIIKYQTEARQNELRQMEIAELTAQLEIKRNRQHKLHERVAKNKIYDDYLMRIVDNVPENYLEYGVDSPVKAIMRRYETLSLTNESLVNNLTSLSDEQEKKQHFLEMLKRQHDTSKLMMNSELSELQIKYDTIQEKNKQLELNFNLDKSQYRNQSTEVASLLLAIANLAEQCHMKYYGPIAKVEMLQKLDMIKEYILEKSQVEKLASNLSEMRFSMTNPNEPDTKPKKESNKESLKNSSPNTANMNRRKSRVSNMGSKME